MGARRLIDDQGSRLEELRAKWMENLHLLAAVPADRAAAEQAATELYHRHGRPVLRFMWADPPVSAALIVAARDQHRRPHGHRFRPRP